MSGSAGLAVEIRRTRDDREFLPAALEILETPPSPTRMALIVAISAFVALALIWSYFGRVDIVATAQGKLQPTGRVKVIQAFETSRVVRARGENGLHVRKGDVLVELDRGEADADAAGVAADLQSYRAEALRRRAAIEAATTSEGLSPATIDWPSSIPLAIRTREAGVMQADLLKLVAQIASLKAQSEQKRSERVRLDRMIDAQSDLIRTLQQRVDMRTQLMDRQAGSKSSLIDAMEALQSQKTVLVQETGQRDEAEASLVVLDKEIRKAFQAFNADNAQKLADVERQVNDLDAKLVKATARVEHMTLVSPVDGVVQASMVTTVGQVVTSGEELMRIVPEGAALEIECYLPNRDIAFVREGQDAIIKIDAFPFTRYGTIKARVERVGRDAIPTPDANQQEASGTQPMRSGASGAAQRIQNLVFPITLRSDQDEVDVDGARVHLQPGMTVSAEIRTGQRRVLDYVLSPVAQMRSESMHER